jgi:hypothetical protein
MTVDVVRDRALQTGDAEARAYYKRLEDESRLVFQASPYDKGAKPVPLHFDFSYDYYPTAYHRPGGIVDIYRLNDCRQGFHRVKLHPYGYTGLQKGVGSSYGGVRK